MQKGRWLQLVHSGSSRVGRGSKQAVGGTGEKRSQGPTKHAAYLPPALALNPHSPQSAAGCLWLEQLHQKLNGIMTEPFSFLFFF